MLAPRSRRFNWFIDVYTNSLDRQNQEPPAQASFLDLDHRLSKIRPGATWEGSTLHAISKLAKANVLSAHKVSLEAKTLQSKTASSRNASFLDYMDKDLSLLSSRATAIGDFLQVFWRLPQHLRQKSTA